MNLGDVMRELGLDSLVPDSRSDESTEETDEPTVADESDTDEDADETSASAEADTQSQPQYTAEDGQFEEDAVEQLRYDLDDVRNRVESNESTLESLRNEQDSLEERLDSIEETNATLLGVYDQLTEDINPFSGSANREATAPDDETYGVMSGDAVADAESDSGTEADDSGDDSEVVSFSDLKEDVANESADEPENEPADEQEDESSGRDAASVPEAVTEPGSDTPDSPYLSALAPTYATDVLLMQWVSMLVDTAGPAGALKTIDYYAQINWISPGVKRQVETVLSGAYDLEADQPSRPPSELSVEAHNESFEHIQRLARQTDRVTA